MADDNVIEFRGDWSGLDREAQQKSEQYKSLMQNVSVGAKGASYAVPGSAGTTGNVPIATPPPWPGAGASSRSLQEYVAKSSMYAGQMGQPGMQNYLANMAINWEARGESLNISNAAYARNAPNMGAPNLRDMINDPRANTRVLSSAGGMTYDYTSPGQSRAYEGAINRYSGSKSGGVEKAVDELVTSIMQQAKIEKDNAKESEKAAQALRRRSEAVERSWDRTGLSAQKADESRARRVDETWDRAALVGQSREEARDQRIRQVALDRRVAEERNPANRARILRNAAENEEDEVERERLYGQAARQEAVAGRGAGRILGLRPGRIQQYMTFGFIALEASRVANTYRERDEDLALAGNLNNPASAQADFKFQQGLAGTPIVGPVAEYAANSLASTYGAGRLTSRLLVQQAEMGDKRRAMILENRRANTQISYAAGIAGADEFQAARLSSAQEAQQLTDAAEDRRRDRSENENSLVDARRAELASTISSRAARLSYTDVGISKAAYDKMSYQEWHDKREETQSTKDREEIDSMRSDYATKRDSSYASATAGIDMLQIARLAAIGRKESAYNIATTGSIVSNEMLANNNAFGAQLYGLMSQTSANYTAQVPGPKRDIDLRNDSSKVLAFIGQSSREAYQSAYDATASTTQIRQSIRGDVLGAVRTGIERERDKTLAALPDDPLFNMMGGDYLRSAVNANATAQMDQATQQWLMERTMKTDTLNTQLHVASLQADRRPLTSEAVNISETALNAAKGLRMRNQPGDQLDANTLLKIAEKQEVAFANKVAYGGQATEVAAGTTGNSFANLTDKQDDTESVQDILTQSLDEQKRLRDAINTSAIGVTPLGWGYW